jgi:molecular chaperone GrpE
MTKKHKDTADKTELERRLEAAMADEQARAAQEAVSEETMTTGEDTEQPADEVTLRRLENAEAERDTLKDQVLRARAEFDNFRKRMAREAERVRKTAAEQLITDLLPVLDHLEMALLHANDASGGLAEGVGMVVRQFRDTLGRHGLEPIDALDRPFDPNVHEAVMQREDPGVPHGTVLEEFQRGYQLGGQVLRPSKVVVSTGGSEPEPVSPAGEDGAEETQEN